jgi:nucleotide-binding universal stress UspA family protein
MTLGGFIDPAWEAEALHSAREYVGNMAQHLRDAGLQAEGHVALGEIASQIALCADAVRADMIVMSTHAVRWPGDATLSSVADAVLRGSNRAVLLVRREPPAGDGDGGFRPG